MEAADISSSDHDAILADLLKHPGFEILKNRVDALRDEKALKLAKTMIFSNSEIDQRLVDEMRGFWRGVDWFIRETKRGANAFDKGVDEQ